MSHPFPVCCRVRSSSRKSRFRFFVEYLVTLTVGTTNSLRPSGRRNAVDGRRFEICEIQFQLFNSPAFSENLQFRQQVSKETIRIRNRAKDLGTSSRFYKECRVCRSAAKSDNTNLGCAHFVFRSNGFYIGSDSINGATAKGFVLARMNGRASAEGCATPC